jgi:hypothetical protein
MRPLYFQSTLALLMALVCADHTHHTLAADDLAVAADFLDRSRNSHFILLKLCIRIHFFDLDTACDREKV